MTSLLLFLSLSLFYPLPCNAFIAPPTKKLHRLKQTRLAASDTDQRCRRDVLSNIFLGCVISIPHQVFASVADESASLSATYKKSASSGEYSEFSSLSGPVSREEKKNQRRTPSDEIVVKIPISKIDVGAEGGGLGIELGDIEFRTNRRVFVKSISSKSVAEHFKIQKNWIFVSINGRTAERTDAKGVNLMVAFVLKSNGGKSKDDSSGELELVFRDPSIFKDQLQNLDNENVVTTQVAPAGDTTQRNQDGSVKRGYDETNQDDQRLTVSQLVSSRYCSRRAETGDLLEISYVGIVAQTGAVFDGSAIKINGQVVPGRGNDVSLFFVLGKQPFGQFPPGWDVGLDGICVGERRRIIVPPVLAYGSTGLPRRNIPPNATLIYDISLVSLNGLATQ